MPVRVQSMGQRDPFEKYSYSITIISGCEAPVLEIYRV